MKSFVLAIVLTVPTISQAAPSLNLPGALADTKAILGSGGAADIVVLGDSLSFRPGTYLDPFRAKMQTAYGNAGAGYQGFSFQTGGAFDSGWVRGTIGNDVPPHHSLDGLWASSSASSASNAYFVTPSRDIELHYVARPGGGTFRTRDGYLGPQLEVVDTNSAVNEVRTLTRTLAGTNPLGLQYLAENVTILGQNDKTAGPGVRVHRAANGGWGADNFLQRDWTFDDQLELLDTDLVMAWIGANDPEFTKEQYKVKMNALVDRINAAVPDAEIVLIGTYDLGFPAIRKPVDAMEEVATERGVGFISMYEAGGSYDTIVANGWLDDGVHLSPAGGEHFGQLLFDAFQTDGASLVPEPATGLLAIALPLLLPRRRHR